MAFDRDVLIALLALYVLVFIVFALGICTIQSQESERFPRWVPAVTRRDACAMPFLPIFYLLPAIFWPLTIAYYCLHSAKTICGIPLRPLGSVKSICGKFLRRKKHTETGSGDSETTPDLELGIVAGGGGGVPDGGGEGGSGRAKVRSADSPGSDIPPPYFA